MSNVVQLSAFRRPAPLPLIPTLAAIRVDVYQDGEDEPAVTDWPMGDALGHLSMTEFATVARALEAGDDVRFGTVVVRRSSTEGRR
jgi:hypothetical protein